MLNIPLKERKEEGREGGSQREEEWRQREQLDLYNVKTQGETILRKEKTHRMSNRGKNYGPYL